MIYSKEILYIIGAIVLAVMLIVIGIILIIKFKGKNKNKLIIDDEFINSIYELLGNRENVKSISVDNARLKFDVIDLNLVNLNGLKELSQNGVFVTNNVVKTLFKFDSKEIKKQMERG